MLDSLPASCEIERRRASEKRAPLLVQQPGSPKQEQDSAAPTAMKTT
jgi:hypothetical protein